ncbi:hypothetical protein FNV43_RR23078 [Rhamnella rubrinervis]|uniref:Leucine-rich repeat-containing N-terminal plant-type domain-containing protein n=1 Tax=Rhamnella rubrinervis TaxID=2594499 RepID=A0A8K0GSL9_9ROSA|nr:hypothetical protein FNV43_RR23078 [Rhamnella rubrinervis]
MGVLVGKGCSYSPMRCIESERQALLSFKQSFVVKDDDYPLSSWTSNTSQDCCSWDGIGCDLKTNHVIQLLIGDHQVRSEISPSLLQLKHLELLDLSGNNLSKIPEFIGSFRRLTNLDLSRNPISGTIPSQLGNLTSLRSLSLGGTMDPYSTVTVSNFQWISRLSSLKYLTLIAVNFTTTSDWFQSIKTTPSLTELILSGCQLPEVDTSSLSHHTNNASNSLKSIDLAYTTRPKSLPWLLNLSSNLVDLTFENNHIGGPLPDSFGNMPSLENINLQGNEIEGEIPKSLGTLCNLKSLDLSSNKLSGTLENLLDSQVSCSNHNVFPALEELHLTNNLLEGPLPISLRQFPKLHLLSLENNLLTGTLPNLSPFSSLEWLSASNNTLDGSLPESIGQLRNLTLFDVSSNSFSGVLSEAHLMNVSKLKYLDLSFNSLTLNLSSNWVPPFQLGTLKLASFTKGFRFPNWLRTQSQLSALDISNSNIFGVIPSWFSNVSSNLGYLNISFNHFSGTVPNFSLKPGVVTYPIVDLSYNQFHGAVPPLLSNASELYLSNNKFTGFKRFLCTPNDMLKVIVLDLSDNLLSGAMPDCWFQWRGLGILNLENNNLSGIIHSSMGSLGLQTLRLRNNSLSGNLPSFLINGSSEILLLDVGHNRLNGKIPSWIGETVGLKLLSLKSNKFYGSIPSNLCHLDSVQILDLSLNNLSGVIPSCINNFTSMARRKDDADETISNAFHNFRSQRTYANDAMLMWKGLEYKYDKILGLLRLIDLSSNRLSGQIPATLANLVELVQLNLSRNHLSGIIPMNIGELNRLESLDLSHNKLSGRIPMGLAKLSTLSYLDLSNNSLWGKIPTSTQLQSFDASRYGGNLGLCGPPLTSTCPGDKTLSVPSNSSGGNESYIEDGGDWLDKSWFNIGIGVGFVVGFWGVCGTLTFKTSWRRIYFRLLNKLGDQLYVTIMVQKARLKRRVQN